jgi:hypothetical protein
MGVYLQVGREPIAIIVRLFIIRNVFRRGLPVALVGVIAGGILAGCDKGVEVKNVMAAQTITLSTEKTHVYAFSAEIDGWIDGDATIRGVPIETNGGTLSITGKIAYSLRPSDWYSTNLVISYQPKSVKGGNLKIRYRFHN